EIYRSINFISISFVDNFFNHPDLLYNMSCGRRFNSGLQIIELEHCPVEHVGILLNQFHGFEFFQYCFIRDLILSLTSFFLKMTCIGNIANIPHFIPKMHQIPIYNVEGDKRPGMPQMTFTTYSWSAYIHSYMPGSYRFENFFLP